MTDLVAGWKSRLYKERYQIVAQIIGGNEVIFRHLHTIPEENMKAHPVHFTFNCENVNLYDGNKCEIYVMGQIPALPREVIVQGIMLELMAWWGTEDA